MTRRVVHILARVACKALAATGIVLIVSALVPRTEVVADPTSRHHRHRHPWPSPSPSPTPDGHCWNTPPPCLLGPPSTPPPTPTPTGHSR